MPTDDSARKDCLALILETKVMTISTGKTGPWAAPVYYLYTNDCFNFFSNPNARHIKEGVGQVCAVAVFKDTSDTTRLQGIQVSGRIGQCPWDAATAKTALAYARLYGIKPKSEKILEFFKQRFHARMYRFIPDDIYYMDNRRGLGTRTKIEL